MNNHEDLKSREQEISRKRKNNNNSNSNSNSNSNNNAQQISKRRIQNMDNEEHNDMLTLSLSVRGSPPPSPPPPPPPPPPLPQPLRIGEVHQQKQQDQEIIVQTICIPQPQAPRPPLPLSPHPPSIYISPLMAEVPVYQRPELSSGNAPMTESSVVPVYQRPELSSGNAPSLPRPVRSRRNPTQGPGEGKSETVPALFPWATTHRATVHSLTYLMAKRITTITGEMQCKKCEKSYEMGYDLREKFYEVGRFIAENKNSMHDRAPIVWMNPVLPTCKLCDSENSAKPVIPDKKKQINWLFLLLGQLLGCCTLDQLKYFCKHTKNHRTGAKDRVLYLTYLGLCKQLDPDGPFDR